MVRGIDYDDSDAKSYKAVTLYVNSDVKYRFETGDFVKDWYDCLKFIIKSDFGLPLGNSSSVDHFIMDGGSELYDSVYLDLKDEFSELVYDYVEDGIELFVPKDVKMTWKEMKEKYDSDLQESKN